MKKPSATAARGKRPAKNADITRTRGLIKRRPQKDRPMGSVTLRMPGDVVEDLKRLAPALGFTGYQALIRAYIGKGLRVDLARLDEGPVSRLIGCLKRRGVTETVIKRALADCQGAKLTAFDKIMKRKGGETPGPEDQIP